MSFLLKFGIGGVQESIAQARKTRDLAAGSALVSELTRAAAAAAKNIGATLVLPAAPEKARDWPHQLVVRIHEHNEDRVRAVGKAMVKAVGGHWNDSVLDAHHSMLEEWASRPGSPLARLEPDTRASLKADADAIENQISESIELYWVAVPEKPDYKEAYGALTRLYDERRHTRTFGKLTATQNPWTCSLCGVRSAVIHPGGEGWPQRIGFASGRERFCAVCAAKRQGFAERSREPFPSTHRLARDRFLSAPEFGAVRDHLERQAERVGKKSDELIDELLDDLDDWMLPENDGEAKHRFGEGWTRLKDDGSIVSLQRLSPYYALILLDGDRMGKRFSGENTQEDLAEVQSQLSGALGTFGADLECRAKMLRAYPVYVGGDDALLFSPLDALLPLLEVVGSAWVGTVAAAFPKDPPTLTLHASVLHAKEPLQAALHRARELLQEAKGRGGRNCFSLYADVRAGAPVHFLGSWDDDLEPLIDGVESFSDWRRTDRAAPNQVDLSDRRSRRLPSTLVHTLVRDTRALFESEVGLHEQKLDLGLHTALELEVDRLIGRSSAARNPMPLRDWLVGRGQHGRADGDVPGEEAFREALLMVAFLARELAWKREPSPP